jgi:CBS domain-containing protein
VSVVEEGRLVGMVSERDLFALQRTSMRSIVGAIDRAGDEAGLRQSAADIARLAENLIAQGVGAEHLAQLVATLNDRLVARILELESARHDLRGISVCWIALGSEGRYEQTLATDQDNGLVFETALDPAEARARLLPFAQAANRTLDACGFPLCKGNIMAGNPEWCLSGDEWRARFSDWIRIPVPQALLNATIFFDLRPLWGEERLAASLRGWLADAVKGNERFLRAMTQSALESRAPGGLIGSLLAVAKAGDARHVDLKASGTRPFVDAARILALSSGIEHTNTAARLRGAGPRLRIPPEEVEAMVESFHFVLLLRLRHQMAHPGAAGPEANRIDPDALNELDRRILKEAMRHARKLQDRLALDYRL